MTARAMVHEGKLKYNNDDGRLSGLDVSKKNGSRLKRRMGHWQLCKQKWKIIQRKHNKELKNYFDRGTRVKVLKINDIVLEPGEVTLELDQRYDGPYRIISVKAPDTYQLELVINPTKVTIAHANKL